MRDVHEEILSHSFQESRGRICALRVAVKKREGGGIKFGGAEGDRTPDLMNAIHALSQLSYGPIWRPGCLASCVRAMIEEN